MQHEDRVWVPSPGIYTTIWCISSSCSTGTKDPTQVEVGNLGLSRRFLEHCPVTSPATNQKEVIPPSAQMLPLKNLPWKSSRSLPGSFEHKLPILLAGLCNKPFSAPSSEVLSCLVALCIGYVALSVIILTEQGRLSKPCLSFIPILVKISGDQICSKFFPAYNDYGNELWTLNSEELFYELWENLIISSVIWNKLCMECGFGVSSLTVKLLFLLLFIQEPI